MDPLGRALACLPNEMLRMNKESFAKQPYSPIWNQVYLRVCNYGEPTYFRTIASE